jgi:cytochrome b6-f complex subunit 7
MSGELTNAMFLSSSLILVGIGVGFLLLKIQGGEQ